MTTQGELSTPTERKAITIRPPAELIEAGDDIMGLVLALDDERIKAQEDTSRSIAYSIAHAHCRHQLIEIVGGPLWPIIEAFKGIQGGFDVDGGISQGEGKPKRGYRRHELVEAVTNALIDGYRFTGDEFMIIQRKAYPHTPGMKRLLMDRYGVRHIAATVGEPRKGGPQSVRVPGMIEYTLRGEKKPRTINRMAEGLQLIIPAREKDTADTIAGKAKRRLFMLLLETVTAANVPDADAADTVDGGTVDGHVLGIELDDAPEATEATEPATDGPTDTTDGPTDEPEPQAPELDLEPFNVLLKDARDVSTCNRICTAWVNDHPEQRWQLESITACRIDVIRSHRGTGSNT
jgi:hypothetical protein